MKLSSSFDLVKVVRRFLVCFVINVKHLRGSTILSYKVDSILNWRDVMLGDMIDIMDRM